MAHDKLIRQTFNTPIPDYGWHMPVSKFVQCCKDASLIDYDGSGYYANATEMFRNEPAIPSEVAAGRVRSGFTHVVWFNK